MQGRDLKTLQPIHATLFACYDVYGVWEERSGGLRFDLFDGNRCLAENRDAAACADANVDDFLSSHGDESIGHFIIYGNNVHRVACVLAGRARNRAVEVPMTLRWNRSRWALEWPAGPGAWR